MHLKRKLLASLVAAGLATFAAGALAQGEATGGPDRNGTIVLFTAGPNETLDPAMGSNDNSQAQDSLMAVYDRLIHFDSTGRMTPGLATSWKFIDKDLSVFELTLRDGVTFHDGTKFDVTAVVANFNRSKKIADVAGRTFAATANAIKSVEATKPNMVTITLNKPDGAFAFGLVGLAGMMISPASLAASTGVGTIKPIGAGSFRVESFTASDVTTLARYEHYWGGTGDRPAHLEVHYVPQAQTRLNAVRSGQANVVLLEPYQIKDAQASGLQIQLNRGLATWTMYPNLAGPLKDLRVRQALSMAIDREGIAKGLTFGTGVPTCQPFPPGYWAFVAEAPCVYDPTGARKLLAETGYPNGLKLDFVLLNTPEYTAMTEAVQANLQAVGITMNITTIDVAQFGRFVSGKLGDFMMGRWGSRVDPLTTLQVLTGPGGTYTPGGTIGPEYEALLKNVADIEAGDPRREAALRAAARYSAEHFANFNIVTRVNLYAYHKGCILNLVPYLAAGSDEWRNVTIAKGCS